MYVCVCVYIREYRSRFASEDTVSFCLRVMVGVIILYDYVHPVGAFAKSSKIDVSVALACPPILKHVCSSTQTLTSEQSVSTV